MTYNFDMERLLDTFDGDAEKLANAFADALNEKLAQQRKVDHLKEAANDVADMWNDFLSEYEANRTLPKGFNIEDLEVDGDTVIALADLTIKLLPYIQVFTEYMSKMDELNKTVVKPAAQKAHEEFDDVMKKFFDKNHI